MRDASW